MNENEVINKVVDFLVNDNYVIKSTANTSERGHDIIAVKDGVTLIIEAKGATSSKINSRDYGKPWGKGKLSHSLAQAILRTMETIAEFKEKSMKVSVGIALPDMPYYRTTINKIGGILSKNAIIVYLVTDESVEQIYLNKPD